MLSTYIEGLQDGLDDDSRTAFRTMFVLKRDVATAIALAKFYDKAKELFNAYQVEGAAPNEYIAMVGKELADLDTKLYELNDTT